MSKQFFKIFLVFLYVVHIDVYGREQNDLLEIGKPVSNESSRKAFNVKNNTKKYFSKNIFINKKKGKNESVNNKQKLPEVKLYNKRATIMDINMKKNEKITKRTKNYEKVKRPKIKLDDKIVHEEKHILAVIDPYKSYAELNPYDIKNNLLEILKEFSYANVTAEVIGRTVEYKDIVLLKITEKNVDDTYWRRNNDKYDTDVKEKKIIFIVHGLSTSDIRKVPCLSTEIQFKELISFYLSHLKDFDIFIIPLANPDGFATNKHYWNKNVSPQHDCGGVALDRNFDVAWNANHTIFSCSQFYPGPKPFSEAESKAIKNVFHRYATKITAYINVHATNNNFDYRGDTVLYPKGYTDVQSDEDKYIDLKGEIDEAISNASFKSISVNVDTLYNWYGKVLGTSVDYASKVYGIPFAMEFLMQPYDTNLKNEDYVELHSHAALVEIWKRVIDTVFKFIQKTNNPDEID